MAYDFTREGLLHPERRPVFVALDTVGRFDPTASDGSLANAWWLANASQLAYYDQPALGAELGRVELDLVRLFDDAAGTGTQAFVAAGAGFAIASFRGTEPDDLKDVKTDLRIDKRPLDGGAEVHGGFLKALDGIWGNMHPVLSDLEAAGASVWITGHSLGGALATLAAARYKPAALYTYGSPRVGGHEFRTLVASVRHERFVNCTDIVTTVPPRPYRHVGRHRFFTSSGQLRTEPRGSRVLRDKTAAILAYQVQLPWLRGRLPARHLADHAIVNYIESIERSLALARGALSPAPRRRRSKSPSLPPQPERRSRMDPSPAELAQAWFDAWKAMDIERLMQVLAPDFVHTSPLGRLEGRDHYLAVVEPMARESVVELTVHETLVGEGVAAVRFTNETPKGPVESCDWIRVEGGRIKEIRSFYDASRVKETLEVDSY